VVYKQEVSASDTRLGAEDALRLAREVATVVVAKGKKIVTFDMQKDPPGDDVLLAALLGPTGNLRAPTIRQGKTLLVGFDDEMYRKVFE
jgi:hypothetical protein